SHPHLSLLHLNSLYTYPLHPTLSFFPTRRSSDLDENYLIESEGDHTVTRLTGNVDSNPMYRLKGIIASGVNNSISVTTNGLEMKIVNAVLLAEETLVIDTDKMTAYVEDENGIILRNALPYLEEIQFPSLHVGMNTLAITTNNAVFTALEIKARSRWR